MPPPLLTVREAAARLRVSTASVYKLAAAGKLPHLRVGGALRFDRDELERHLRAGGLGEGA